MRLLPTDRHDNSILNENTRFNTEDPGFYPNARSGQNLESNGMEAGWSMPSATAQWNSNDGYPYHQYPDNRPVSSSKVTNRQRGIRTDTRDTELESDGGGLEDVFDSYSMDLNTFKAQTQCPPLEFNDNEEAMFIT